MSSVRRVKSFLLIGSHKNKNHRKDSPEISDGKEKLKPPLQHRRSISMDNLQDELTNSPLFKLQREKTQEAINVSYLRENPRRHSKREPPNGGKLLENRQKRLSISLDEGLCENPPTKKTPNKNLHQVQIRQEKVCKGRTRGSRIRTVDVYQELIKSCGDKNEKSVSSTSGSTNQLSSFPVSEEDFKDVEIRTKSQQQQSPQRPKTLNSSTPVFVRREGVFEVKGPFKLELAKEICVQVKRDEKLCLVNDSLRIVKPHSKFPHTVKSPVVFRNGAFPKSKRTIELRDVDQCSYFFHFESSKDARNFLEMKKGADKSSIKQKLLKLLGKRSSRDLLESKGIIRNEAIFGNTLRALYEIRGDVPEFIVRTVGLIEDPENIDSLGLYRASANLAIVQKIRFEVDCGRLEVLEIYKRDVDVLCSTLKLFFRELRESLIPYEVYLKLQADIDYPGDPDEVDKIVDSLPKPNKETLQLLIKHFLRVCDHQAENKMDIHNLAISWGPSLITLQENCVELVIQTTQYYKVTEHILKYYSNRRRRGSPDYIFRVISKLITKIETPSPSSPPNPQPYGNIDDTSKILQDISRRLQTGDDEIPENLNVADFCALLKMFVRELQEPLIPPAVIARFFKDCDSCNETLVRECVRCELDVAPQKPAIMLLLAHFHRILYQILDDEFNYDILIQHWCEILLNAEDSGNPNAPRFLEVLLDFQEAFPGIKRGSRYDNVDNGEADILDLEKTDELEDYFHRTKL